MSAQPLEFPAELVPHHRQALPALRRLPVPVTEPRAATSHVAPMAPARQLPGQGTLDLESAGAAVRRLPRTAAGHRPRDQVTAELPEPRRWAAQFVQAAAEVAAGYRPCTQLLRWTSEEVYTLLTRRGQLIAGQELAGPARTRVQAVRTCLVGDAVEAAAVVTDQQRVRAMALRMEGRNGRWRVTALEIG
jgi:hypothetical protein